MDIGIIGLGKMGLNLALNLSDKGIEVYGFDSSIEAVKQAANQQINAVSDYEGLLKEMTNERIILMSLPAGEVTNDYIQKLGSDLNTGDIVIDMSNSHYKESVFNYNFLKAVNIDYLDCGISGGMEGARRGASLMIGGDESVYKKVVWLFKALAVKDGFAYVGQSGSGHYLKMIHNGIEYGMMQAIGEGFQLLDAADYRYDFKTVSKVWNNGSIIESYLMGLVEEMFEESNDLREIVGEIDSSGEGKWTVEEALKLNIPLPVITSALYARNITKLEKNFSAKVVAGMRNKFGGHKLYKNKQK